MSTDNQNFIVGLVSAIALVVGLIYTFISIHKTNLEIRKLQLENQKQKSAPKNKRISQPNNDNRKFSINTGVIIDVIFFLFFSIGSINAIVEFISNTTPVFALISAQFLVLLYSVILLSTIANPISQQITFSNQEKRYFTLAGVFGLLISLGFHVLIGIQRLGLVSSVGSPTNEKILSLVENLAIAPLLVFSLVTLYRIIRYISSTSVSQ